MAHTNMTVIDGKYVKEYVKKWANRNDETLQSLSINLLGRSKWFISCMCRENRIRPFDLRLLVEKTGLDYDRATWVKPAEPEVKEVPKHETPDSSKYAEDLDVRLGFIEKKLAFIGCKLAELVEAQTQTDVVGVLHEINETLKNFAVANRSGSEKLYNQIKYGGRTA